jgi:hypothetical protein
MQKFSVKLFSHAAADSTSHRSLVVLLEVTQEILINFSLKKITQCSLEIVLTMSILPNTLLEY